MRALVLFLAIPCFGANSMIVSRTPVLPFEAHGSEYVSRGPGYTLSVSRTRQLLQVGDRVVSMSAAGANRTLSIEPLDRMPGRANYFIGRDHRNSYDLYGRVRWRGLYRGIDAIFHANPERLEYDFEIAARVDPSAIQLAFEGVDTLSIDPRGDLVLTAGSIQIRQPKPIGYQIVTGTRHLVDVAYRIDSSRHVRFRTASYDRNLPLVIDPQIVFDKSFGGSGQTTPSGLARDSQGNLYITGSTNSTDFGAVHAAQSQLGTAPLIAFGNNGSTSSFPSLGGATMVFSIVSAPSAPSTFYAGTSAGIFQSSNGGITWTATASIGLASPATTLSVDSASPTTLYAGTAQKIYVSTDGAMTWRAAANGIGGSGIASVAASPTQPGTVFASVQNPPAVFRSTDSGQTWSMLTFPVTLEGPVQPILFTSAGSIIAGAFEGIMISTDGGNTWAQEATVHAENNVGLAIAPNSNTLYLFNPDTSKLEISTDGGQTFTALPLSRSLSFPSFIAVDPKNAATVYVASANFVLRSTDSGQTWSQLSEPYTIFPQTIFVSPSDSRLFIGTATQNNAFVIKWSPDASQVLYSTYLGGSGNDQATAIALDPLGDAFIAGRTTSPNFPTTNGAILSQLTTSQDIFVSKLSPDGSQLLYSTLLGSDASNPTAIAVDVNGSAVITGRTGGSFPVTGNAFQKTPLNGCTIIPPLAGFVTSGSGFAAKLTANGQGFLFSTLFGGSCATYAMNAAIDSGGNTWVVGSTTSSDFPVTSDALQPKIAGGSGYYDGFLTRFDPNGELTYSSFLGGPGYDSLNAIAFDVPGNIYLTGESGGLSIPPRTGFQPQVNASCYNFAAGPSVFEPMGNGMILKLDPAAQVIESLTYFGAPGCLNPNSIAVDSNLNIWVSGDFSNANFTPPTVNPIQFGGTGFLSKFSPDLTQLLFSTYFDSPVGLALDASGFAYTAGSLASAASAYVAKIDPTAPPISVDSIASVAPNTNAAIAIAPGEVILMNGRGIGPAALTPGVIQQGFLSKSVAGVQVTFDGLAVPLLSVSAGQIELVTPFEIAGKSKTSIQVSYNGAQSNTVSVPVNATAVQILGIFNSDFTPNSQSNPAAPNSNMTLYIAGLGNTAPPSQDGQINGLPPASAPVSIEIGTFAAQTLLPVTFAGAAYGLAAGIYQINFIAPAQTIQGLELMSGSNIAASFDAFVSQQ